MRQLCMARSDLLRNVCNVSNFFYEDIYKDKHLFDLSNYPSNEKHFDSTNKKVPGVLKDETSTIFFWSDSTYMYVGRKGLQGSKILTDSIVI